MLLWLSELVGLPFLDFTYSPFLLLPSLSPLLESFRDVCTSLVFVCFYSLDSAYFSSGAASILMSPNADDCSHVPNFILSKSGGELSLDSFIVY